MKEDTLITRQEASKLLRVSTRTIDRYIADRKISVVKDQGRSLLRKSEVETLHDFKNPVVGQVVSGHSSLSLSEDHDEIFRYKYLYEEVKEEVQKRDEVIRHMHYRLGVLETEAKNTVPLLEAKTSQEQLEQSVQILTDENQILKTKLETAKVGRTVFFVIAGISFVLLFISLVL